MYATVQTIIITSIQTVRNCAVLRQSRDVLSFYVLNCSGGCSPVHARVSAQSMRVVRCRHVLQTSQMLEMCVQKMLGQRIQDTDEHCMQLQSSCFALNPSAGSSSSKMLQQEVYCLEYESETLLLVEEDSTAANTNTYSCSRLF